MFWIVPPELLTLVVASPVTVRPPLVPVLLSTMPLVPPLAEMLTKLRSLAPIVVLTTLSAVPPADVMVLPVPSTLTVPPLLAAGPGPVALKPMPLVVVMSRPVPAALKLNVVFGLVTRFTAVLVSVTSVVWPLKLTVPPALLVAVMPRPPLLRLIVLLASKSIEPPTMPWMVATLPPGLVMSTLLRSMTALTSSPATPLTSPLTMKAWLVATAVVSIVTLLNVNVPVALLALSPRISMPREPLRSALLTVTLPAAPSTRMPEPESTRALVVALLNVTEPPVVSLTEISRWPAAVCAIVPE